MLFNVDSLGKPMNFGSRNFLLRFFSKSESFDLSYYTSDYAKFLKVEVIDSSFKNQFTAFPFLLTLKEDYSVYLDDPFQTLKEFLSTKNKQLVCHCCEKSENFFEVSLEITHFNNSENESGISEDDIISILETQATGPNEEDILKIVALKAIKIISKDFAKYFAFLAKNCKPSAFQIFKVKRTLVRRKKDRS